MFNSIKLIKGEQGSIELLSQKLAAIGYQRREGISEQGDFSVRGDTLLVFPATFEFPLRVEFSAALVNKIVSIDKVNFKAIEEHSAAIIIPFIRSHHPVKRISVENDPIDLFVDIAAGDYVVHTDYGIGQYLGNRMIRNKAGKNEECLAIQYQSGDILYVSTKDIDKVQKYISFNSKAPVFDRLGSTRWARAKERIAKGVYTLASDILEVQAKRETLAGHSFSKDTEWQRDLEEAFPYKDTADQKKATDDVKKDMELVRPMDRLLCGDVGYGKTEVALRAAFKAVMDNKQVAILVPTTILAEQHFNTFSSRMSKHPVRIEMLSRFKTRKEQDAIVAALGLGQVDIVIGTHRLLSSDIKFKDLGLYIIDEEQRFGVLHKERLKKLRLTVDVLTLTATPIPRTLYLALLGGKDISVINTPPLERLPVETTIIEFNDQIVKDALAHELDRKGQIFFVHNRIDSIERIAKRLTKLAPQARVSIGHGRMTEHELERTMMDFIKGRTDILVCTTIIESGIDIPNANTIFIDNAQRFGLADLYQLRGRVGRYNRQAKAYFIVNNIQGLSGDEKRRLDAIRKFVDLGSGFKIAMQDLELRGAGNLVGTEQHGYIDQIGFDLYCRLLRSAIERQKTGIPAAR